MDTNVAVVANGNAPQASYRCVAQCIEALLELREKGPLLLDDRNEILEEYRRHLAPSGQPGPGDAFFKWLWRNQAHPDHCKRVSITPVSRGVGSFEEFPDDPELATFDPSDRKFVAVALASGDSPPILNATDSDWWHHKKALARNGVEVRFLCPELMSRET